MSFSEQKESIDENPKSVRYGREKLPGMVQESKISDYVTITKDKKRVKYEKRFILEDFSSSLQKSGFDLSSYKQIDQGSDGACTLVALMHLIHINGLDQTIHNKSWSNINKKTYWKYSLWNALESAAWDQDLLSIRFFADTLDLGVLLRKRPIMNLVAHPKFRYIPIRGDSQRELLTNPMFFTEAAVSAAAERFRGENVKNSPVTCCVGQFIEYNLDCGNVLAVSFNGHARVAVAYNDTHLLFADSWDNTIMEEINNKEIYVGGVSVVPKFNVYAYARDIVYFESGKALKTPPKKPHKISAAPKKPRKISAVPKKPRKISAAAKKAILKNEDIGPNVHVKIIGGKHAGENHIVTHTVGSRVYFNNNRNWTLKKNIVKK
tara:strand:+ start:4267 stop:5400 length:1134 start_codon:yes stop_codon:yes gene_type:complete